MATKNHTARIGYVSPESGYTILRREVFPVNTMEEMDIALDAVAALNRQWSERLRVTFQLYTQG